MAARCGAAPVFTRGILRTVRGTLKRFIAIATITALGVTMLVGLRAACVDLRYSADSFFDEQNLFDIRVQSTLGLTDDDVAALAALDGVEAAEGGWSETVYTTVGSVSEKVDVRALSETGMNAPIVLEGHLPERDDQVAVTRRFLEDSGLCLGDTVTFHGSDDDGEDSSEVFERKEYTIIAVVLDPMDINAGEGTMSFRSSGGSQYTFFVLDDNVLDQSFYTVAYLSVEGAADPLCYSDEYEQTVDEVLQRVEDARAERERARGEGLRADAAAEVDEAEAEALAELDDAQAELDDAQAELDDAQAELDSGRAQLDSAERELSTSAEQVEASLAELAAGLGCSQDQISSTIAARSAELDAAEEQLASARSQLEASASMLSALPYVSDVWPASAWARLAGASSAAEAEAIASGGSFSELDAFVDESTAVLGDLASYLRSEEVQKAIEQFGDAYEQLPQEVRDRIEVLLDEAPASIQTVVRQLLAQSPSSTAAQLDSMSSLLSQLKQIAPGMVEVIRGEEQAASGRAQLEQARSSYAQLVSAQEQLESGRSEIASGHAELDDGQAELDDGQAELDSGRAELEEGREDALSQIADARAEIDDIPDATWYVQDRSSLSSYASVDSDASSIETIGNVLPIVFFVVAVLISLTTMTRMVEEERELIGLYKALGYGRGRILSKYALYATAACVAGWLVGTVLGFVVLPAIIFTIFSTMYALPGFEFTFDPAWSVLSLGLFLAGIVGATAITCRHALRETPASLMRPKAPKAGSRIFLEHIGFVWRRMSFLNKVTARNLFRYKQRFLMTTLGVAGCVALLVTGFGIRDTVVSLSSRQYGEDGVIGYDLMAVTSADDLDAAAEELLENDEVSDLMRVYIDSLTASYDNVKESVQLVVVPDGASLAGYVNLTDEAGAAVSLDEVQVAITKNAEQVMGFAVGDEVDLQDSTLAEATVKPGAIVLNYLGNTVFMTQSAYEQSFGGACEPNGVLVHLTGTADEQIALSEQLSQDGRYLSVVSTQKLVNDFSSAFTLINTVVYVVIVLAAALAFTVVFTLSNTNISERERELATLKVLGFHAPEVHSYINKETLILTGIGVVLGLPMGYALARSLTWILKMPSLYFDVVVDPLTFVISATMACVFTVLVNLITNRALDRIDMVGALKSPE